jgi:phosphatidylglycerol---prolipoprotein diacylglyceryl transferase
MNTIEFPNLWGLHFQLSSVAFSIKGIEIKWYGIIIALGFLTAVLLAMRDSEKFGINSEDVIDVVLFGAPAAIVGARLFYVLFRWNDYKDNIKEIFFIRNGGLAIYGGLIGALIAAYLVTKYKKINVLNLFDLSMPFFALAQAIGRWGNFFNQEAFGTNTSLPWGMTGTGIRSTLNQLKDQGVNIDPNLPVHPTFLYESLWNIGVFAFLIWFRKKKKLGGEVFFLYMILYGIGRAWIEPLRTDSLMLGNFRISMVLALLFALTFATIFFIRRQKAANSEEGIEIGTSQYGALLKEMEAEENKESENKEEIIDPANKSTDDEEVSETIEEDDKTVTKE